MTSRLLGICGMVLVLLGAALGVSSTPQLHSFTLGGPEDATLMQTSVDGSCVVKASGVQAGTGRDEATFAGFATDVRAFTFIAHVTKTAGLGANARYGIAMRASQWGGDKAVSLCYDTRQDRRCLQWFMRHTVRLRDDEGAQRCFVDGLLNEMQASEGFWLKLVRRYPYVDMACSADGATWQTVPYRAVLLSPSVWVGLQATAGSDAAPPMTVTYDSISYTVDADAGADAPDAFREYAPPTPPWRLYLAQVPGGKAPFSAFLMMPKDMDPQRIRAILFTPGNKEVLLAGNKPLAFDKEGLLRKPATMTDYEGSCELDDLRPGYQALAQYGIVRVGGYFSAGDYARAIERLAAVSGIAHLPNIPVLSMGDSAAVGPERCIAGLGMPGADTQTPRLFAFNTQDGGGLRNVMNAMPGAREKHALWGCAPMWTIGHKPSQTEALIFPFFLETLRLRVPADADYRREPVQLCPVREEDGWLGLADTWNTNFPQILPCKGADTTGNRVWLPSEAVARIWQAAVANFPRTVIHFPTYDGNASYDAPLPANWHNSTIEADVPFELVASGPAGKEVTVEYYEGTRALKAIATHGSPYRVTLEGLAPGLHAIHAVTTVDGVREVSHPVLVTVVARP